MNIFDTLNFFSKSESIEVDKIVNSIHYFVTSIANAAQYKATELYNLWIREEGIIPTTDRLALWALEYIAYVAKDIPTDLLKLETLNK